MRDKGVVWLCAALIGTLSLASATTVSAATITIGSPLTTPIPEKSRVHFSGPETVGNTALAEAGAHTASPISGTVVRWRIAANSLGGPYELRVLKPDGNGGYKYGGISAPLWPNSAAQTVTTNLPIQAGDLIGLEVPWPNSAVPFAEVPNSRGGFSGLSSSPVPEGDEWGPMFEEEEWEFGFNADVQPPPAVTSVSPSEGSIAGGTAVTITGTDFEGATVVKFGDAEAQSFTLDSETQLTAIVPSSGQVSSVPISVTTPAGTTTQPSSFDYIGCVVPRLKGLRLKAARALIRARNCAIGHPRKRASRRKAGRIISQQPAPRSVRPPGSTVIPVLATHIPSHRSGFGH